jgi:hypothetical protein
MKTQQKFYDKTRLRVIVKVESLQNPSYTLQEWKKIINDLIEKYGKDAILERDEGHENCGFEIVRYDKEKKS